MGVFKKAIFQGRIAGKSFIGIDLEGNPVTIDFNGGRGADGSAIQPDMEKFNKGIADLITLSAQESIKHAMSKQDNAKAKLINEALPNRISRFLNGKEDVKIEVALATGFYVPDAGRYKLQADISTVSTSNDREFFPIKPIELEKNGRSSIPVNVTYFGMKPKKELLDESRKTGKAPIFSAENEKKWYYGKLSVGDVFAKRYEPSSVFLNGELNKQIASLSDVVDIFKKEYAYLEYRQKSTPDESFKAKTHLEVNKNELLSQFGGQYGAVKKVFETAREKGQDFFIPMNREDGASVKINLDNLQKFENSRDVIGKLFSHILSQKALNNSLANLCKFIGDKENMLVAKKIDKYSNLVTTINSSFSIDEYKDRTFSLVSELKKDGVENAPVEIYIPLSTKSFAVSNNPEMLKNHDIFLNEHLSVVASDLLKPVEDVIRSVYLSKKETELVSKMKDKIKGIADVVVEQNGISIEWKKNELGYTQLDFMSLNPYAQIESDEPYLDKISGEKREPIGFRAFNAYKVEDNKVKAGFNGLKPLGARGLFVGNAVPMLSKIGSSFIMPPLSRIVGIAVDANDKSVPQLKMRGMSRSGIVKVSTPKEDVAPVVQPEINQPISATPQVEENVNNTVVAEQNSHEQKVVIEEKSAVSVKVEVVEIEKNETVEIEKVEQEDAEMIIASKDDFIDEIDMMSGIDAKGLEEWFSLDATSGLNNVEQVSNAMKQLDSDEDSRIAP